MRRHDGLGAGAVVLPGSPCPPGPSAHQRMGLGGQRCPKRCFRTRPWVPSWGWLGGVLPQHRDRETGLSSPLAVSLGRCRGRLPHPDVRGLRRRSSLGYGREGDAGGRAGSRSRATDRPSIRARTDDTTRSLAWTSRQRPRPRPRAFGAEYEPRDVTGPALHCGRTALGCAARVVPRENPDAMSRPGSRW
jgi:hypothetical protein